MPNELIDNEKINNLKNLLISGSNNEALLSDITNLAEAKALLINLVSTKKANGEN
jgi:hypothetical protein